MIGIGMHGFVGNREEITIEAIEEELANPTDRRIFAIAEAFYKGYSVDDIHKGPGLTVGSFTGFRIFSG